MVLRDVATAMSKESLLADQVARAEDAERRLADAESMVAFNLETVYLLNQEAAELRAKNERFAQVIANLTAEVNEDLVAEVHKREAAWWSRKLRETEDRAAAAEERLTAALGMSRFYQAEAWLEGHRAGRRGESFNNPYQDSDEALEALRRKLGGSDE